MPTFLTLDGTSLHYNVLGDERVRECPVIVLAGGAARHPGYLGDLAGLADSYPLVVPHLRGVGRSPAPDRVEVGSFWRQAEDIEAPRVHLGAERVVVAGHSAGTRVAIAYADQFPRRLAGLVLVTPPAGYLVDEPSDAGALIDKRRGEPAFDAAVAALAGPRTRRVATTPSTPGSKCLPRPATRRGDRCNERTRTSGAGTSTRRAHSSASSPRATSPRVFGS